MLVQTFRREVPEHGALTSRTMLKDTWLSVAVLCNQGLAVDRGVTRPALEFPKRFRRTQLTLVLSGRGYLELAQGRVITLCAGDVALSHQSEHRGEGYFGGHVILVDWDGECGFAPQFTHIAPHDVLGFLSLANSTAQKAPVEFVRELALRLQALGLPRHLIDLGGIAPAPAPMARLYAALGHALSSLDQYPSLPEVAHVMHASERNVHRQLAHLAKTYGHSFVGWRDFVSEMRLDWATQLLSIPRISTANVARLAGYRSAIALNHAYRTRGADTPAVIARRLAEHWR
jgi:AraC-like DNA-binding protein